MEITTSQLGWAMGWVISIVLAVLRILEYRRDRPNIKVTVRGHYGIIPEDTVYGPGNKIIIRAVNKGRRTVTLTQAGLLLPRNCKDCYAIAKDSLAIVELGEGKPHTYILDEDEVKRRYNLTPDKYVAYVINATGKFCWSHNKLKRLIKLDKIK